MLLHIFHTMKHIALILLHLFKSYDYIKWGRLIWQKNEVVTGMFRYHQGYPIQLSNSDPFKGLCHGGLCLLVTKQYWVIELSTRQHNRSKQYSTVLHCTAPCSGALHCTALHCTALYCTALVALYCTALGCTVLYCTALFECPEAV